MSRQYSDHGRQKIANEEYTSYSETDPMKIKNDKGKKETIGIVRQVIENETGLKAYVVESPDKSLWYTRSKSVDDIFVKYHKGDVMKSLKIIGIILASLLVIVGLSVGGYKVMKQAEHDEMVRIVESEEAKQIFRNRLKRIDPKAFEPDGVIKTYAINYDSIASNPMGGIMVSIYVNDNKDYIFSFTLNKNFNTKKLTSEGGVNDPTIMKKVEERDKND